jgi:cellulose synthase/poly-beta-1,6-N-acetylglucosamine synthase-like glycosyltransferase
MELLFWVSLGVVLYVYAGYPVLLEIWSRVARRVSTIDSRATPPVSVVIAARNEAERLPGRIENLLRLDYPPGSLEIVVVSDGSTDGTRQALAPWTQPSAGRDRRVRLIELDTSGKAAALNAGVEAATHDILVFADARQRYAPDAVRRLVGRLADPAVGAVSGELVLDCEDGVSPSTIADGVGAYWRYEKWLRARESEIDSTLGATGAIYALRRTCWQPLPRGTILDDVLAPMRAVLAGWRVVFEERARAFDAAAPDAAAESRRKTRTLAGNYQLLTLEPRLLLPVVNRVWLQFVSHKLGRLLVPWALVGLFVASLALATSSALYLSAAIAQGLFYGLALYGGHLERQTRQRHFAARARVSEGRAANA